MVFRLSAVLVLSALACVHGSLGLASPGDASYENELRVGLTQGGFNKLKSAWGLTEQDKKGRTDLNVDLLESGTFLLRYMDESVKLRFMKTAKRLRLQTKTVTAQEPLVGAVLVGKIKETLQSSVRASDDPCVEVAFGIASASFENILAEAPMRQSMDITSAQLFGAPCLLAALDKIGLGQSGGLLLPAARSVKERFETSFSSGGMELEVILGATWGIGSQGEVVVRYEVEADAPGRITPESRVVFEQFLASLENAGLGVQDVDPTSFESFAFAEQRYKAAE